MVGNLAHNQHNGEVDTVAVVVDHKEYAVEQQSGRTAA